MKQKIVNFLAFLCYWSGVTRCFYRLNRGRKRILVFHNILPEALFRKDLTNSVSNSETEFRAIIREVKRLFPVSCDLFDPATVTLTFDDGYRNQAEVAARVLQEEGNLPAILFVAGDVLDSADPARALIIDRLLQWTASAPCGEYRAGPEGPRFTLADGRRDVIWRTLLQACYQQDAGTRAQALLDSLDAQYPLQKILEELPEEYKRLRLTGITSREVGELRARGWQVGWHSQTHFPLNTLPKEEKVREIAPPAGFERTVFSYPYGCPEMVDGESVALAAAAGYPCAVSNTLDGGALTGPFFLPRLALLPGRYRLHFQLSGLEHFIKTRRRLPKV